MKGQEAVAEHHSQESLWNGMFTTTRISLEKVVPQEKIRKIVNFLDLIKCNFCVVNLSVLNSCVNYLGKCYSR